MGLGAGRPAGRVIDAALELLDRQLVDSDDNAAGKIDDLELEQLSDGAFVVSAILSGPGALAPRLGGRLGTAWASAFRRLHPEEHASPARIGFGVVRELGPQIRLSISRHDLDVNRFEHWTREHLIRRIPGADRAVE
jgi:hypothetical protein